MGAFSGVKKREVCEGMPSTRWKPLRFLWSTIWKTEADPWLHGPGCQQGWRATGRRRTDREMMVDEARK